MPPDLIQKIYRDSPSFDFFQAVALLEDRYCRDAQIGRDATPGKIRFEADNSIAFPASDIKSVHQAGEDKIIMHLSFMGLYGVSSPLPSYFSDPITTKKDHFIPLRKFLDIFGHRLYALYYRAWKKYRHSTNFKGSDSDMITSAMYCLTGQGISLTAEDGCFKQQEARKIIYGMYCQKVRSAENLKGLLSGYFQIEPIQIKQFASRLIPNPAKLILGDRTYTLGKGLHLGKYLKDRTGCFIISIGPVPHHLFQKFFPSRAPECAEQARALHEKNNQGSPLLKQMKELVQSYLRDPLDFIIEVILDTSSLQQPSLGSDMALLGRGFWLGKRPAGQIKISSSQK